MAVAVLTPSSWSPFSIRTVVNSGKICVLNLQPSSLPSIHESDLKPYVVFLTPSSPQMSRQQAAKQGQVFKVTMLNISIPYITLLITCSSSQSLVEFLIFSNILSYEGG